MKKKRFQTAHHFTLWHDGLDLDLDYPSKNVFSIFLFLLNIYFNIHIKTKSITNQPFSNNDC